ncbi:acyl-coenzyme A thioesterase PaaI-like protein [Actinomadura luteofluorescens]|uniref:Acyl-coenzyme A thioesterase THEM4 n=1 Tax=Actinomadura luteofluorescens TaxID=46163 RepID=A0A7Y9EDZ6_9ACTN|nr:PaaI family thioesterase [Actinomadura luteofluorescens]NYD45933.1 acyl-coenzyme A thioesterase PaaI-like protein [Actinomadura luteofluorescens]
MSAIPMERPVLGDDEAAALTGLAARVRELAEATVLTGAGAAEAAAVADEIAALTARLTAERRGAPPFVTPGERRMDRQIANPVSGPLNPFAPPIGLDVTSDGVVRGEFTLGAVYEGPPSYVHGGVSAMVLDQALGMAAAATGTPGMTATLETRYRRPTPLGVPLKVEAKASRVEGRKVYASGTISAPDGRVTVEATAMFIMPQRFVTSEY